MSEAVNVIAEGEVLQLMNVNDPDITEENYMRVIYSKTARLLKQPRSVRDCWPTALRKKSARCRIMAAISAPLSS